MGLKISINWLTCCFFYFSQKKKKKTLKHFVLSAFGTVPEKKDLPSRPHTICSVDCKQMYAMT